MNETAHFSPVTDKKLACACCGVSKPHMHLLAILELVRLKFGKPVNISSGYRCPAYNAHVGGATNSMHLTGKAADIYISGVEPKEIYDFLVETFPKGYGFACYQKKGFVHCDVRERIWRSPSA